MPRLVVVEGANRGAVLRVLPDRNRLGRGDEAELSLPDDGISRLHAELAFEGAGYVVRDLASKNGTFVNGVRIAAERPLAPGDELRMGGSVLVFVGDDEADADALGGETASLASAATASPAPAKRRARTRVQYLVGESEAMKRLSAVIERCAPLEATILVTGESGTGKELVAEALHRLSRRAGPFLAVNGANLEPRLLESDLFGHERGAFTGAVARKLGKLELARGGTLFLDEVGELPLEGQAKLLRAIERREFQRLGGNELLKTDARLVAATNRDLAALVREGRFREDLLFRLQVVPIVIPPLRERPDDVAPLVEHFVAELRPRTGAKARGFSPAALARLRTARFPGNVRELRNLVERCLIFAEGELVQESDLGLTGPPVLAAAPESIVSLEEVERAHIARALAAFEGNKTRVAERLGIDRATLYAKIKRYGL